jgi:hypothetical protein
MRGIAYCYSAFLAELGSSPMPEGLAGVGVAHWDPATAAGASFGPNFTRHAAAQSILEALDPTPDSRGKAKRGDAAEAYWSAKRLPQWLRFGIAVHAERYLTDSLVEAGGDPHWLRKWSVSNIANKGGLDPLPRIFEFELEPRDCTATAKLLNEAGLLVSFLLDSDVAEVRSALQAFVQAFTSGSDVVSAARKLGETIVQHEAALRAYAGL